VQGFDLLGFLVGFEQQHQGDDEFRRVAERGVEQPADAFAAFLGEVFRRLAHPSRERNDCQTRRPKNQRGAPVRILQHDGDGQENQKPVEGGFEEGLEIHLDFYVFTQYLLHRGN